MSRAANKGLHVGLLWLRVLMGFGMAYHGFGKVFGGNMDGFIQGVTNLGFPKPEIFAWAAALSEFGGGLLIVIGLLTRPAALFVLCTMFVAAFMQHSGDPFKDKELALAYLVIAGALMMTGAGRYSLDDKIKKKYSG
ncbi:MAG: DoxX family protein [Candidatus Omnitrophica bacterium]|nr:DoxX family protein [Candidatus Omnitrophota bacterium]